MKKVSFRIAVLSVVLALGFGGISHAGESVSAAPALKSCPISVTIANTESTGPSLKLCPCGDDCKCPPDKCPGGCPAASSDSAPAPLALEVTQVQFKTCPNGKCPAAGRALSPLDVPSPAPFPGTGIVTGQACTGPTCSNCSATVEDGSYGTLSTCGAAAGPKHPFLHALFHPFQTIRAHRKNK